MNSRFLALALLATATGVLLSSLYTVRKMTAATMAPQISQILKQQKAIEQKLTSIESKLNAIQILKGGAGRLGAMPPSLPPAEDLDKEYKIDVGHSSVKGKDTARVTIVEFSDFQCPYSQRFHPVVEEVLKAYPDDTKFIFKNFPLPFHPQAKPAAKASLAAREQGKYWEMADLLFQNGRELSEEKFKDLAKQLGLDVDKFMKDYQERDAEWEKLIEEDMEAVRAADVGGTPTFYINGKKTMARDLETFKAEIDKILKGQAGK